MRPKTLKNKLAELEAILENLERIVVAFSGGVDSSLLLAVAVEVLGRDNVLAVTAVSPTSTREELAAARGLARLVRARHEIVKTGEFSLPAFACNPPDRCYHCKRVRFRALRAAARAGRFRAVCDGSNADDVADYRPGMRALEELGIRSPLREAGMTKADVRAASKLRGVPGWDRPAAACLASRCPYGERLTPRKLRMIEEAERYLTGLGFAQVRVRTHEVGARALLARIELPVRGMDAALMRRIERRLRKIGYLYVTLDLAGYRMGSLNLMLPKE
jgi:pyridinium-3,5-biscarboxylic acid mononucleotide sulfurtransferase